MESLNCSLTPTGQKENRIVYAGHADQEHADFAEMARQWRVYPASEEGIKEAVRDGYTAISIFEFSHPVEKDKAQPMRYGDMVLDFDAKKELFDNDGNSLGKVGDIGKTLEAVRIFSRLLTKKYDVNPNQLHYYASGGKGFHVVIPRELIGSEPGDIELPATYRHMLQAMLNIGANRELWDGIVLDALKDSRKLTPEDLCIDPNGFKGGKGQLIRLPHIQRADGKYKVPVTYDEIMRNGASFFEEVVRSDRHIEGEGIREGITCAPLLEEAYLQAKKFACLSNDRRNANIQIASIETECEFVSFCAQHAGEIAEPQWFALARIMAHCGALGQKLFHMYSQLDPQRYNEEEARRKLRNAYSYPPVTCKEVQNVFPCSGGCRVKCPMDIYRRKLATTIEEGAFAVLDEGLVFYPDVTDKTIFELVSSHVDVKASARDAESCGWSKIIEVRDPDGVLHQCRVPFTSLNGSGDEALVLLSEAGLQLEPGRQPRQRLLQYLNKAAPKQRSLIVEKNGWIEKANKFVPFDLGELDGCSEYLCSRFPVASKLFEQRGTLEEWKKHVGVYCKGNPLLQVVTVAALSGPLLAFMGHSGFGIHLYGNSSSGKTTSLHIAGSVTGGELKSWRTTDNGLEGIAEQHNDNCLLLDEISQCDPDVVAQVAYMLANGQGKSRSSKTGVSRRVPTWNLTFLSSGEVSISDRADQGHRNKAMAGHEVRVISILADGGTGYGIFTVIPDGMHAGAFSDMLIQNSKQYRGASLRAMIQHLKDDRDKICNKISQIMDQFLIGLKHTELSSQAKRVANHFALLAGVGEVAIELGILPWSTGEAMAAMNACFRWWRRDKNGAVDFEIEKATEKLLSLARNGFYGKCDDDYPIKKFTSDGRDCFFIPRSYAVGEICKEYQYKALVTNLKEKGLLILTREGDVREQFWQGSNDNRPRGFAIIRDNLYDTPDVTEVQQPLGKKLGYVYKDTDDDVF
ncbi:DUF927 domain-containing protein [Desulfovibrio desulfuricans]|uniref:DUF927 domain-containing protein n=1 Tax=Desulfovibrio desulfuricans TaxID=876 RepID=UPI001D08A384|nr:DUF927 domain-containing protein [Desulfovibrio desulfuricans]MCB6543243.1 DUF927 domain-containing protein [Desulfovibrio desulfuricans]MCB6554066.1 DUF927 domain-containing protein [Desulfovibrio desulfuricans]MCB6566000.1 DUF927 domain-containing protein [Desulfovibrio desulfuricans]MCB7347110.1 DUF927 domain-containing protein [Desulfovibrio desulfuricans]MCQ5219358.1 DUF927 domain-containing protein [Desulfovibrio desulfuricans]